MTGGGGSLGALPEGLPREELVAEVRRALGWLPEGSRAGLAVSGGADSVAMAHLVTAARGDLGAVVLHVRHGLREDRPDVQAAEGAATSLGLPYVELPVDVRPDRRTGLEAAARSERLDALARAAAEHGAAAVLLAHTAEDQAETVLLNLGRGSGLGGLSGMPERRAHGATVLARPLLRLRRADVRGLAARSGWAWAEDPTNADPRRRRTIARRTLLPALSALSGGPGDSVAVLTRLADLARDDAAVLDALAAEHAERHTVAWGPLRALPREVVAALPTGLARRVVRGLLAAVRGGTVGLPASAVEAALSLGPGGAVDVAGGVRATCGSGWLVAAPGTPPVLSWRPLPGAGTVALPEIGAHLCVVPGAEPPAAPLLPPGPGQRRGDPVHACTRLTVTRGAGVRGWRSGDRVALPSGETPLADLLARAGVPRPVRSLVPVVVDGDDRPLWAPGVCTAPPAGHGARRVWLAAGLG